MYKGKGIEERRKNELWRECYINEVINGGAVIRTRKGDRDYKYKNNWIDAKEEWDEDNEYN